MTPAPLEPAVKGVREWDGEVEIDLDISPDLFVLQGHFPEFPVVPGVAQIDWAMSFAGRFLGIGQKSAKKFRVKFRSIIKPGSLITLDLKLSDGKDRLSFAYRRSEDVLSSGQIRLDPAG